MMCLWGWGLGWGIRTHADPFGTLVMGCGGECGGGGSRRGIISLVGPVCRMRTPVGGRPRGGGGVPCAAGALGGWDGDFAAVEEGAGPVEDVPVAPVVVRRHEERHHRGVRRGVPGPHLEVHRQLAMSSAGHDRGVGGGGRGAERACKRECNDSLVDSKWLVSPVVRRGS